MYTTCIYVKVTYNELDVLGVATLVDAHFSVA